MKKGINGLELNGSDEILQWPDGCFEIPVLERLLVDANEQRIPDRRLVRVLHRERAEDFSDDKIEYGTVGYQYRVEELRVLYSTLTNGQNSKELKSPSLQEVALKARLESQGLGTRGYRIKFEP